MIVCKIRRKRHWEESPESRGCTQACAPGDGNVIPPKRDSSQWSLFLASQGSYWKGPFRVEKDREILHWVSGFGITSLKKEDLL
jgi:hypothetical protein